MSQQLTNRVHLLEQQIALLELRVAALEDSLTAPKAPAKVPVKKREATG